jgi:SAM-dependent methyltransferase
MMHCTVCHSLATPQPNSLDARIFYCKTCCHRFSVLLEGEEEEYSEEYFLETHKNWFANPNYALFDAIAIRIPPKRGLSVIDVGCGQGAFLRYLSNKRPDLKLTGIDLFKNTAKGEKIDFIQGDFLLHNFHEKFDMVVSLATIEHVSDVHTFAEKLINLCNPNGMIVIMTINDASLLYLSSRLLKKTGISFVYDRLYSKHHLNHFSGTSLEQLFLQKGKSPVDRINHHAPMAAIDIHASTSISKIILGGGLKLLFGMESVVRRTYLQTIFIKV